MKNNQQKELEALLAKVRNCHECADHLPYSPRPVLTADVNSPILIIGQAPGRRVQKSGIPWDDPSGDRLRTWMGVDSATFYDKSLISIIPMGFCYPGTGKSGDLPPRPECAKLWHSTLMTMLTSLKLTLLVGNYAQRHYLAEDRKKATLTKTVANWKKYCPKYLPLPHPSPRNNLWLRRNPWFVDEVVPYLRQRVNLVLANADLNENFL